MKLALKRGGSECKIVNLIEYISVQKWLYKEKIYQEAIPNQKRDNSRLAAFTVAGHLADGHLTDGHFTPCFATLYGSHVEWCVE